MTDDHWDYHEHRAETLMEHHFSGEGNAAVFKIIDGIERVSCTCRESS